MKHKKFVIGLIGLVSCIFMSSSPRAAVLKFQLGLSLSSLTHLVFLSGWEMKRYMNYSVID